MHRKARPRTTQSEVTSRHMTALPLAHCINDYLADCRARGHSPRTVAHYSRSLQLFDRFLPNGATWTTASAIREAVAALRTQSQYSTASISMYTRSWRAFLRFCQREELIPDDLARYIKPPKTEPRRDIILDAAAINKLLDAATKGYQSVRDVTLLTVMFDTGLRAGELCALAIRHVDMGSRTLTVPSGKTGARTVPIGRTTAKALRRWLSAHPENIKPAAPLFPSSMTGEALTVSALRQCVKRIGQRAGLTVHPHQFRHSFAVEFLRNGGDTFSLQRILGHSSLEMTRWYAQLADADVQARHNLASPADRLGKTR